MPLYKNDADPTITKQGTKIIPEVVKIIYPARSSLETTVYKKPEKKISITKDINNKKIISYDSRTSNLQNLSYIYKWRDSNKTLIISSEPPPENITHETFYFDQTSTTPTVVNETDIKPIGKIRTTPSILDNSLRVYTPDGLRALIKQSKEIGDKLELRGELLDELTEML